MTVLAQTPTLIRSYGEIAAQFTDVSKQLRSVLLRCRLTVFHFVLNQPDPVIIAKFYARQLQRRSVTALLEWARVVIERNQRQKTLGQMFLHTHVRPQQTIETFHRTRRADDRVQRFLDLALHLGEIFDSAAPVSEID